MKNLFLLLFLLSANLLVAQDIVFRTNVEHLRLREQPNLGGKIIKTVPKETVLYWSGERSKEKVMADWNGSKVADYWYQVKFERDSTAWVFGKGIEFIYCQIGTFDDKDMINYTVENEWLDIIKSNATTFRSLKITPVEWKNGNNNYKMKGKPFKLNFTNGTRKTYNEFENEEYIYAGELVDIGCYIIEGGICCNVYSAISKKDGKDMGYIEMPLFTNKSTPIFSKDKKTFVSNENCEPGGEDGIEFYSINADKIKKICNINLFPVRDFRFITNRSGIAKLEDGTYWKITLKN